MLELTPEEIKKSFEEANRVVKELRETVEAKNKADAEKAEKIAKMEKDLAANEKVNQDITQKMIAAQNEAKEFKEKLSTFEKILARPNLSGEDKNAVSEEMKSFSTFVKKGVKDSTGNFIMTPEELKYLRTDSNVEGGFLAPPEYINEIIKKIVEIVPARSVSRVRKTSLGYVKIPSRTAILTASRPGEGGNTADQNSTYGEEQIFCPRITAVVPITVEMINDSAFNMESEINSDVITSFAKREGLEFISGNGVKEMEGILTNPTVQNLDSGIAASYTADKIIEICGLIKTGYNPVFGVNRYEIAFLRSLKDGMGQYLWQTGIAMGRPNTLNGFPYVEMPDLDRRGANKYPIVFGDFYQGYNIVDGIVMTVVRDPYTLASDGKIKFVFYKGLGGKVVLPEAIAKLRCHV